MCGDCFVCIYLVCQCDGLELGRRNRRIAVRGVAVRINSHELSSCLQIMNKMMSLFPGANNMPPFTQQDLKNVYFKMMPIEWQHAFINNCQDIASPNYTLLNLQQYMGTQETLHHALTQTRCSHSS